MKPCCEAFCYGVSAAQRTRFEALSAVFARAPKGDIVELGVASGVSFRCWGHLQSWHGGQGRLLGFDTFAGFPALGPEDGPARPEIGKRVGGETEILARPVTLTEVEASTRRIEHDDRWGACRAASNGRLRGWRLVRGAIERTLPRVIERAQSARALQPALVFFDADLYAPTKVGLEQLWPLLVPGGLCVFDEYGQEPWSGETKAVDDFALTHGLKLELLPYGCGPNALLVKP